MVKGTVQSLCSFLSLIRPEKASATSAYNLHYELSRAHLAVAGSVKSLYPTMRLLALYLLFSTDPAGKHFSYQLSITSGAFRGCRYSTVQSPCTLL